MADIFSGFTWQLDLVLVGGLLLVTTKSAAKPWPCMVGSQVSNDDTCLRTSWSSNSDSKEQSSKPSQKRCGRKKKRGKRRWRNLCRRGGFGQFIP